MTDQRGRRVGREDEGTVWGDRRVKREFTRRLGQEPDPEIFETLVLTEKVAAFGWGGTPDELLEDLLQTYRKLEANRERHRAEQPTVAPEPPKPAPRDAQTSGSKIREADEALRALSEIWALEAAQQPYVREFRERVLGGQLLKGPREIREWRQEREAGWRPVARAEEFLLLFGARHTTLESELALREHLAGTIDLGETATPGIHEMDFLFCVCDMLEQTYGWNDIAEVVALVLAGITPSLHSIEASWTRLRPWSSDASVVNLRVIARVSPAELRDFYAGIRGRLLPGKRPRSVTSEDAELALFAVQKNDGRSWKAAMDEWDGAKPYQDPVKFSRACRAAYKRITGTTLVWQSEATPALEPTPPEYWREAGRRRRAAAKAAVDAAAEALDDVSGQAGAQDPQHEQGGAI